MKASNYIITIPLSILIAVISTNFSHAQATASPAATPGIGQPTLPKPVNPLAPQKALPARIRRSAFNTNPTSVAHVVGAHGPNSRTWLKVTTRQDNSGRAQSYTNLACIELATGMHYWQDNQWKESREIIEAYPDGAIAQYGQHKVIFGNNLNAAGAIDLQMADGKELRSHVLGLAYYDTASGKSVLIAELKDCQGEILGSNQVVYADAFNGVSADVRFRYTRAGMEQDVILLKQPPAPEAFGLASGSSILQVWTEFLAAPTPNITATPAVAGSSSDLPDQSLDFGAMRMIEGQAFLAGQDPLQSVRTAKQWIMTDGRSILVESVRVPAIAGQLAQLPLSSRANLKPAGSSPLYAVSAKRLLPAPPGMKVAKKEMAFAGQTPLNQGLLLDYLIVENGTGPTVFQGDTTYFVSGPVYCQNVTLEGGAVIKYPNHATAFIRISGALTCQTAQYRPAILTAGDDDSVGQSLNGVWSGYTGVVSGYYANQALYFQTSISQTLSHIRVAYANTAVLLLNVNSTISDAQFVNCETGVGVINGCTSTIENALFSNVQYDMVIYPSAALYFYNVTFDQSGYLCNAFTNSYVTFVNCIVADVANTTRAGAIYTAHNNGFYKSPPFGTSMFTNTFYPFQTVGAGNYYLTNGCNFFNRGATVYGIPAALLADLRTKTTHPPIALPALMEVTGNLTLSLKCRATPVERRIWDTIMMSWITPWPDYT